MARLPYVETADAGEEAASIYKDLEERAGRVLNPIKMIAHNPALLRDWWKMMMTLLMDLDLPADLRELALMRIFQLTRCDYCWTEHVRIALESGVTQEQLDNLEQHESHGAFNEVQRLTLRYAEKITVENDVDDAVFDALRKRLGDKQMMELTFCIGNWNGIARFIVPMGLELETAKGD